MEHLSCGGNPTIAYSPHICMRAPHYLTYKNRTSVVVLPCASMLQASVRGPLRSVLCVFVKTFAVCSFRMLSLNEFHHVQMFYEIRCGAVKWTIPQRIKEMTCRWSIVMMEFQHVRDWDPLCELGGATLLAVASQARNAAQHAVELEPRGHALQNTHVGCAHLAQHHQPLVLCNAGEPLGHLETHAHNVHR